MAGALNMGQWAYSLLEGGYILPSVDLLERLCTYFDKTLQELYPDRRVQEFYE